jgi:hypothetical protein
MILIEKFSSHFSRLILSANSSKVISKCVYLFTENSWHIQGKTVNAALNYHCLRSHFNNNSLVPYFLHQLCNCSMYIKVTASTITYYLVKCLLSTLTASWEILSC